MNLIAPWRIWKIRLELARRQTDPTFSVRLEYRNPVRFGDRETKPYWQYVNHIRYYSPVPDRGWQSVKLIIGCEATMRDANGNPRLSDVLELAHEQAAGVISRAAYEEDTN